MTGIVIDECGGLDFDSFGGERCVQLPFLNLRKVNCQFEEYSMICKCLKNIQKCRAQTHDRLDVLMIDWLGSEGSLDTL